MSPLKKLAVLTIASLIWFSIIKIEVGIENSTVQAFEYSPGYQEAFPLFVPDYEATGTEYFNVLKGDSRSSIENIYWFGREWLELDKAGSAVLVRILQSASNANSSLRDDIAGDQTLGKERCGVGGWVCGDDRFNNLVAFVSYRGFPLTGLGSQMLYVGFELREDFDVLRWSDNARAGQKKEFWELLKAVDEDLDKLTDPQLTEIVNAWFEEDIDQSHIAQIRSGVEEIINRFEPPPPPPQPTPRPAPQPTPPKQAPRPKNPVSVVPPLKSVPHNCANPVRNYDNATKSIKDQIRIGVHKLPKTKVTVHKCLAKSAEALFVDLNTYLTNKGQNPVGGWGWRSVSQQLNLRKKHNCPNIYTSPPSQCDILVAIPGRSFHNYGLAIDFYETNSSGAPNQGSRLQIRSLYLAKE